MKLADLKKIKEEGSKKLFLKEDKNYRIVVGLATCGFLLR